MPIWEDMKRIANKYAEDHDTDFVVYFGDIGRPQDVFLIDRCRQRRRRKNLLLMLATRGGDPAVAYRIGRAFQRFYDLDRRSDTNGPDFTIFVPSMCKSAGTILATAASKLIISDFAELGPIEVQFRNPLEAGERISSLAPIQALDSLRAHSKSLFRQHFDQLRFDQTLAFSTKIASEVATSLTVGLLNPVYSQVDPIRLAEVERLLKISGEYTERLSDPQSSSNLKSGAVDRLLVGYPTHNFVIDRKEAGEIFKRIEEPDEALEEFLSDRLRWFAEFCLEDNESPFVSFLSDEPKEPEATGDEQPSGQDAEGEGQAEPEVREENGPNGTEEQNSADSASE